MKSLGNKLLLIFASLSVINCCSTGIIAQACNCAKKHEVSQKKLEDNLYKENLFCEAPKEWLLAYGRENSIEKQLNPHKPCGCGCNK